MKRLLILTCMVLILTSVISGCSLSSQQTWANWQKISNLDTDKQFEVWQEDLDYLVDNLEKKHKNLYHTISKEDFKVEVKQLSESYKQLSSIGKFIETKKLVAKVGDGHTSIRYDIPLNWFPFVLSPFDDGLYVIAVGKDYKGLLGKKLIKIGDADINEIYEVMKDMISRDNEVQIKSEFPFVVKCADFLHYYGYIDNVTAGDFIFEDKNGAIESINIKSYYHKNGVELVSLEEKSASSKNLLYMQNMDQPYWYQYLESEKTIYLNYNSCREDKKMPVKEFTKNLLDFIEANEVEKFIFDIRNNGGGNSSIIEPLIEALAKNPKINQEGRLFVVIGNSTYSSAVLNAISLRNQTKALFIGQPTGGRPNHYGEVKSFNLPNTGLRVHYSTKYFEHSKVDSESILPDVNVVYTFEDYINGIDPAFEAIKKIGK